ncbi:MAG: CDP-alcohol phosphatidyltransferase family protein [Patescibacteria group bacterium]|jgi:phosphatidylglycerophosphate synthase
MAKSNIADGKIARPLDGFWRATLIKILPDWITPDGLSLLRLILIPAVLLAFAFGNFLLAVILFALAALLDSVDGALARQRNIHTSWGLIIDPLADKLLIMMTILYLALIFPAPWLILAVFGLETLQLLGAALVLSISSRPTLKASIFGKTKMLLVSVTVVLIFLWLIINWSWLLALTIICLWLTIILQAMTCLHYLYRLAKK